MKHIFYVQYIVYNYRGFDIKENGRRWQNCYGMRIFSNMFKSIMTQYVTSLQAVELEPQIFWHLTNQIAHFRYVSRWEVRKLLCSNSSCIRNILTFHGFPQSCQVHIKITPQVITCALQIRYNPSVILSFDPYSLWYWKRRRVANPKGKYVVR